MFIAALFEAVAGKRARIHFADQWKLQSDPRKSRDEVGKESIKGNPKLLSGCWSGRSRMARFDAVSPADWDWLVGLYYADGSKFKDKWKHVVVFSLSKSDELAIAKLLKILRTLELRPSILTNQNTVP